MMYLKVRTTERYVQYEELVSFCEEHLIQGSAIEGESLSSQIDNLSNNAIAVGEIFEVKIIPLVRVCNCVELEALQEGLANLQKFLADNSYLSNIDLEWVYKPYKNIFKKAVLNLPKELSQKTINLFIQLQLRCINESNENQQPQLHHDESFHTQIIRRNDGDTSMMNTPAVDHVGRH